MDTDVAVDLLSELSDALPEDTLLTDPRLLQRYRTDRTADRSAVMPLAVVLARTTADVQVAVRWAARHRVPVVPRGAGTGLSGGASTMPGGLVVSTERMREQRIDATTRTVVVQPGLLNAELKAAVAAQGLWYPPDPASWEICSIGGNVATNAGGLCCVKYGVTADYVLGLEVVLADGRAIRVGRALIKDVAGLSMVQLFVGSEGTLGVITEVTLRLLPAPPPTRRIAAWFASTGDAAAAVTAIAAAVRPAVLEYMDRTAVDAVEDVLRIGLDRRAAAFVLAGSDEVDPGGQEMRTMLRILQEHSPVSVRETTPAEGEALADARRMAIPAVERRGSLLLEDVGVAIPRLGELIRGVETIASRNGVVIAFIAHAGDGNTHPLVVFNPADPDEVHRAERAYGEVMTLAIELGGTITGEHGVGKLKRPWLADQIGEDVLEIEERIKTALDPDRILNPGCVFEGATT